MVGRAQRETFEEAVGSYNPDENAGRLLLLGFRIFERSLLRHMADQGYDDIRMSHLPIMRSVARGVTRVTEIGESAGVTKQTAGVLAGDLEAMRYIRRDQDPSDGRAKIVRLAARGRSFMADFPVASQKAEADMTDLVGLGDFATLTRILRAVVRTSGEDVPDAAAP